MATRAWQYLINTFLVNTVRNFKKTLSLITDHLAKLESQSSDADILEMYNTFLPLQESFENLYSQWQLTTGTYEGKTQSFEERIKHFSIVQINVWRGKVFNIFPEHSPTAKEIFPNDRMPFQHGTYEQRVIAFKTLGDKLAEYTTQPTLVTLSIEVLSAHNELKSLRDAQQNKEGASAIFSSALETARLIVCQGMYSNLGLLMSKYKLTPLTVANYFDLSLLRKTGAEDDEDEAETLNGTLGAGNIFGLASSLSSLPFEITPETIFRLKNNSENPGTLIFYPATSPLNAPGPGPQFPVTQGAVVEKTFTELGLAGFSDFNVQNTGGFTAAWEVEVIP